MTIRIAQCVEAVIVRMMCCCGASQKESRMRIAVRIALACLGLLAVTARVRGQTTDTPQTTPQAQQAVQNTNEMTAVPNRPTCASTAERVQLAVFELEYGL